MAKCVRGCRQARARPASLARLENVQRAMYAVTVAPAGAAFASLSFNPHVGPRRVQDWVGWWYVLGKRTAAREATRLAHENTYWLPFLGSRDTFQFGFKMNSSTQKRCSADKCCVGRYCCRTHDQVKAQGSSHVEAASWPAATTQGPSFVGYRPVFSLLLCGAKRTLPTRV